MGDCENQEAIRLTPRPRDGRRLMLCPECDHRLPIDHVTECDNCGAWLTVFVRTEVPPAGERVDNE